MHKQAKRIKTAALPVAITREQAECFVSQITQLTIERNALTAAMDKQIAVIRDQHQHGLDMLNAKIESRTEILRDWALANPEEFGKRKSISFLAGVIGFRTGTPKLKTLSGWTFARVLDALRGLAWGRAYVLVKEDVAKAEILAAYGQQNLSDEELRQIGCRVDQDETFFVEPAVTESEPRQTVTGKEAV